MQVTLKHWTKRAIAAAVICGSLPLSGVAMADSAYIGQIPAGAASSLSYEATVANAISTLSSEFAGTAANLENAIPHTKAGNFAATVTIGDFNQVLQIQTGVNDASSVAILGGSHNSVAVLQGGSSLRSDIGLIGLQGSDIGVVQPNGAAPVNLLMGRLSNGGLLIIR